MKFKTKDIIKIKDSVYNEIYFAYIAKIVGYNYSYIRLDTFEKSGMHDKSILAMNSTLIKHTNYIAAKDIEKEYPEYFL